MDRNVGATKEDAANAQSELVRTSGIAIIACVLGVASLLLVPGLIWAFRKDTPPAVQSMYMHTLLGTSFSAGVLGLVALGLIASSAGQLVGKGFACIGILTPVVQILLLLLVTFTGKTHSTSYTFLCGTNLSGIGKAMLIYANDYEDELPRAGGPSSPWTGRIADWAASDRSSAYGLSPDGSGGQVSISASLYLLVKYCEVAPEAFLCGGNSRKTHEKDFSKFVPDIAPHNGTTEQGLAGNTFRHEGQGQNVMFLDTHVEFKKRPFCGLDDDNIYTSWNGEDKARGVPPKLGSAPADAKDSLLVNDPIAPAK
jgi:hypothetical protein